MAFTMLLPRALLLSVSLLPAALPAFAQNTAPSQPAPVSIPGARPTPGAQPPARTPSAAPAAAPAAVPTAPPATATAVPPAPAQQPAAATAPAREPARTPASARQETPPPTAGIPESPPKPVPLKPLSCSVAEFRAIGIDSTDERTRRNRAAGWLQRKAKDCTPEQLLVIRNNRSQWLGNADSAELAAAVDALLESFAQTNPEVALLLYGTPPEPVPPPGEGANTTIPQRR